jgi:hypothetical protein
MIRPHCYADTQKNSAFFVRLILCVSSQNKLLAFYFKKEKRGFQNSPMYGVALKSVRGGM